MLQLTDERDVENKLVVLLEYDKFPFIKVSGYTTGVDPLHAVGDGVVALGERSAGSVLLPHGYVIQRATVVVLGV